MQSKSGSTYVVACGTCKEKICTNGSKFEVVHNLEDETFKRNAFELFYS